MTDRIEIAIDCFVPLVLSAPVFFEWTSLLPPFILPQFTTVLCEHGNSTGKGEAMSFLWKDDSTSDGPPEKIRRRVQAQVEAHLFKRAAKVWKPGPATRAVMQSIRSLPQGKGDLSALSPQQRFRMEALHAAAVREHQESMRKVKGAPARRPKRHSSSLVLVPRCLKAPYTNSVSFTTPNLGSNFAEQDDQLQLQANGQAILTDTANGVVGQTMVWGATSSPAFLDVTRGVLMGGWIQAGATTPRFLDAHLTTVIIPPRTDGNGGFTEGWVYWFGGGIATYQLSIDLFVFTAASQSTGVPPAPAMRASVPVMDFSLSTLQVIRFAIPANTQKSPSGAVSGISQGTWLLVLAGPVARFFASVWNADWTMGVGTTWSVDKICGYW